MQPSSFLQCLSFSCILLKKYLHLIFLLDPSPFHSQNFHQSLSKLHSIRETKLYLMLPYSFPIFPFSQNIFFIVSPNFKLFFRLNPNPFLAVLQLTVVTTILLLSSNSTEEKSFFSPQFLPENHITHATAQFTSKLNICQILSLSLPLSIFASTSSKSLSLFSSSCS